jgi:hypothetical protein
MVAQYRCTEIKEEAFELVSSTITSLDQASKSSPISDFPA